MFIHVNKRPTKLFLGVNNDGFCSMYVLLLLPIFISFCILLMNRSMVMMTAIDQQKHSAQLLAIYTTKAWLAKPEEVEQATTDEEVKLDQTLQVVYDNISLQITFYDTYNDIEVSIPNHTYQMSIVYTSDTKEIMDIVY